MYLGPFYFDTKEIFLIILTILLAVAMFMGWDPAWFKTKDIFTLHNEAFFFVALVAIGLTLYFPIFQVVLFYFISFTLFRILRII
jgi:hypothetical protein